MNQNSTASRSPLYLVTGAAGFLGGAVCRQLVARGERVRALVLPCGLAGAMAGLLERQAQKSGKKPLLTTFSIYNLARNNDFDSSKARRELGYHTRSYRETMHDEIAWLKATGKIGSVQV